MPCYSPPLPFRRGRAGCPCVLACPRGRPARGSWICTLAGVPRPAPRVGAAYMRAGRRARAVPGAGVAVRHAGWRAQARARSRTGAARVRMGGEGESAQTGDSNPGCNYPVRGYSPSMHFFWRGDVPRYSPPLFSGVFQFLDRYISLARNIGYVTIKPMTKYCPVFMLSLADVQ